MKLYELRLAEINQSIFIAANTIIQALKLYCVDAAIEIIEMDDADMIIIIPEKDWSDYGLEDFNHHGVKTNFVVIMAAVPFPQIIGETFKS